ncbi:unnamed protein product [Menidia menidia]|uniref:Nectin cell adhesion molecule 3 n=1 Tax=Menidia menidia TaxID=238744 RepID=A0A8S4AKU8_9TELE|nr:unnamed protein product [Menidia menidia]
MVRLGPSIIPECDTETGKLVVPHTAVAQKVRVDGELQAYPTESVDLRCQFIDGGGLTKLTQVSWIWEPVDGQRDNIAVFHPVYGQSFPNLSFKDRVVFLQNSLVNPSIRISNLSMSDAGRYTCEYATYPTGNEQGTTTLVMLAKPRNSASVVTVRAGTRSVVVARCEAADGKPAATIKWLASVGGNHSASATNGPDGTVTVRSEYRLVPTEADNGREVTCLVEQRTQDRPWVHTLKLSVEYPPTVSIEGYDNNWYVGRSDAVLLCLANANPAPTTITWTAASGPLPETVVVEDNKLTVRKVDDAVNTTFICEVRNKHGASRHQLTTFVMGESARRPPAPPRAPTHPHAGGGARTPRETRWPLSGPVPRAAAGWRPSGGSGPRGARPAGPCLWAQVGAALSFKPYRSGGASGKRDPGGMRVRCGRCRLAVGSGGLVRNSVFGAVHQLWQISVHVIGWFTVTPSSHLQRRAR